MKLDTEIHLRIDTETKRKLIVKAEGENRSLSNYIIMKLDEVLKNDN